MYCSGHLSKVTKYNVIGNHCGVWEITDTILPPPHIGFNDMSIYNNDGEVSVCSQMTFNKRAVNAT